jgi:hypothetical protein
VHWSINLDRQIRDVPIATALEQARPYAARAQTPEASPDLLLAYLTEMAIRSAEVSATRADEPQELLPGLADALRLSLR